jgi:hypothetical protein
LDTSEIISKIFGKFLKCDAGKGWRRSVEPIEWKMRNFKKSQEGEEYLTYNKKKED